MSIPESQLEIWSHQGSVTQSKNTYATIKHALEDTNAQYPNWNFEVYLQGSYGNDTNIFDESDVDVVICYKGAFFHDLTVLPADQQSAFRAGMPDGTYWYSTFKGHVQTALEAAFGHSYKFCDIAWEQMVSSKAGLGFVIPGERGEAPRELSDGSMGQPAPPRAQE
jgi:hypothetical protein